MIRTLLSYINTKKYNFRNLFINIYIYLKNNVSKFLLVSGIDKNEVILNKNANKE